MNNDEQILEVLTEIRDLLKEATAPDRLHRIDVADTVKQLGTGQLNQSLRHYYA